VRQAGPGMLWLLPPGEGDDAGTARGSAGGHRVTPDATRAAASLPPLLHLIGSGLGRRAGRLADDDGCAGRRPTAEAEAEAEPSPPPTPAWLQHGDPPAGRPDRPSKSYCRRG